VDRGFEVFIALLATAGAIVIGMAVAFDTTTDRNPDGFFVAGGFLLLAAFLVAFLRFIFHPLIRKAARWRAKVLAECDAAVGKARDVKVRSAQYGGTDVTSVVAAKVLNGRLDFVVTNAELGGDPAVGVAKRLVLDYALDGRQETVTVDENARVEIPRL
jgi:hypothetical protein